ncbi:hypothetical protein [Paenibacillus bouchesdurhonensis]|uniref:hypothetical protein n=1 Tax=Paenibacillus bouchesdurhonensis TaxID=1870990 RepID=UPI000DA5EE71|nr:hypothetical protein [Paenibacillus bouchesdurhonensis]
MINKYLNICMLSAAIALALAACSSPSGNNQNSITSNNGNAYSSTTDDKDLIHLVKAEDIIISAPAAADSDVYTSLTVQAGKLSKTFPWKNVTNPTYQPTVHIADVDGDNQNEIIIILTSGYGTGVNEQEIHVLNKEDLSELAFENPLQVIEKEITSQIIHNEDQIKVMVETTGKKVERTYSESDAVMWNEEVAFESMISYSVTDNVITATVPGSVSPALFAVYAKLEYDSSLKVKTINIEPIL